MDQAERRAQVERLLDHYEFPRHEGRLREADVELSGGHSECGDVVKIYLKGADGGEKIADVSFEGEGCTISIAAASVLMEMVHEEALTMDDVLRLEYAGFVEQVGPQLAAGRPRCATLALGTLKAAVAEYRRRYRGQSRSLPDAAQTAPEQS